MSREVANLKPWAGWKYRKGQAPRKGEREVRDEDEEEGEDEDEDGNRGNSEAGKVGNRLDIESDLTDVVSVEAAGKSQRLTSDEVTSGSPESAELATTLDTASERTAMSREEEEDTIVVSSQSETTPTSPSSEQSLDSTLVEPIESVEDHVKTALAGFRCPLCICPINGVYFPTIECLDCGRIYHQACIQYNRCDKYHLLRGVGIPDAKQCEGCECPVSGSCCVYVGHPSIMFHRRDQDPEFEEYFRVGQLEEAKSGDLC